MATTLPMSFQACVHYLDSMGRAGPNINLSPPGLHQKNKEHMETHWRVFRNTQE